MREGREKRTFFCEENNKSMAHPDSFLVIFFGDFILEGKGCESI